MKVLNWFLKKDYLFQQDGKYYRFSNGFYYLKSLVLNKKAVMDKDVSVRDTLCVDRYFFLVFVALLPSFFFGVFNTGQHYFYVKGLTTGFWKSLGMGFISILPILVVVYVVGFFIEMMFAKFQKRSLYPGLLVSGMVYVLMLPPSLSFWKAGLGFSFGLIVGQELFGGYPKSIFNAALLGRLFLFLTFPRSVAGDAWSLAWPRYLPVMEGKWGISPLSIAATLPKGDYVADSLTRMGHGFWALFWGTVPGGFGDTSVFCALLGGFLLWHFRFVNLRIWGGILVGVYGASYVMGFFANSTMSPMFGVSWLWHLLIGGFVFLSVFVATDPVVSPHSNEGKWVYGVGIGVITVLMRCLNLSVPEGGMIGVLAMMMMTPLIEKIAINWRLQRRIRNDVL